MRELILYYSLTGKTKKYAENLAKEKEADLYEITEVKKRSNFGAYTIGIFQVFRGKKTQIHPIGVDLNSYDLITIATPVWASHQAPAINTVIGQLPEGKKIKVIFVSMSGISESEQIEKMIKDKNCEIEEVVNIKSQSIA